MSLEITINEKAPNRYMVRLTGRLDSQTYRELESELQPRLEGNIEGLAFDMEKLDYISSMGIRVLLTSRKKVEANGGKVILAHLQPQIEKVLEIANYLDGTVLFTSVQEADAYFDSIQQDEIKKQG